MKARIVQSQVIKVPVTNQDDGDCGCNNPIKKLWALVPKLLGNKDREVYRFPGVEVEVRRIGQ